MAIDLTARLLDGEPTGGDVAAWAASGAMALTGWPDRPLRLAPASLLPGLRTAAEALAASSRRIGVAVELDAAALLGERAALAGLDRGGRTSCGGATRLLEAADGWVAVSLTRPDDLDLVPAWLDGAVTVVQSVGFEAARVALVSEVERVLRHRATAEVVERARLVGLPVAALGEVAPTVTAVRAEALAPGPARHDLRGALVVNLASLWAGPLCAGLLGAAGARVVKVESAGRPDGARMGSRAFFDLMNAEQESVALDFTDPADVDVLRRLLERADVVIEGSRPRALRQLGIDARAAAGVWISITGYGRDERGAGRVAFGDDAAIEDRAGRVAFGDDAAIEDRAGRVAFGDDAAIEDSAGRVAFGDDAAIEDSAGRVAFGDDAAVAGGLVAWDGGAPCFCADAVADPVTGLVAAAAALDRFAAGGAWLVDVALAGVAARCARLPAPDQQWTGPVAPPRARPIRGEGPALGAHTAAVLAELGLP